MPKCGIQALPLPLHLVHAIFCEHMFRLIWFYMGNVPKKEAGECEEIAVLLLIVIRPSATTTKESLLELIHINENH